MSRLNANDLKTRGVAAIEAVLESQPEAMISVRGKERFVVMEIAHYHYLRECELDAALAQSQADVAAGRFVEESATDHVARLQALLAPGATAVPARRTTTRKPAAGKPLTAVVKQPAAKRRAKRKA